MDYLIANIGKANVNYELTFQASDNRHIEDVNQYLPGYYEDIVLIYGTLEVHTARGKNGTYLQSPKKCYRNGEYIGKLTQKDVLSELSLKTGDKITFSVEGKQKLRFIGNEESKLEKPDKETKVEDTQKRPAEETVDEVILQEILTRRGQKDFRQNLLKAYDGKCAITGCDTEAALEAAHIVPHSVDQSYAISNGLLLRADIHTLFDLHLLSINPQTGNIVLGEECRNHYGNLKDVKVSIPTDPSKQPNVQNLMNHYQKWLSNNPSG